MKRRTFLARGTVFTAGTVLSLNSPIKAASLVDTKEGDDKLFALFQDPPTSAKPFVRWWWNGNLIEKEEICRQLDLLKDNGIGGVEINPIALPQFVHSDVKALPWLSEQWVDMVQFATAEAKKRGLTCDLIPGTGWPYGGPFLKADEQTQALDVKVKTYKLVGPGTVTYTTDKLLGSGDPSDGPGTKSLFSVRLIPAHMESFDAGIDLTDQIRDGVLTVDLPYDKDQFLFVFIKTVGKQTITRGAPGGAGPVLNYFNKAAVLNYLNRIYDAFRTHAGRDLGDLFRAMFSDSLELDGHNWCDDMFDEFEKRRGYSLQPYLPFVLTDSGFGNQSEHIGKVIFEEEALHIIRRVRYDFAITKQELFTERFLDTFQQWCTAHGVASRVQAYGGVGYHPLDASMKVDIPECESWLGDHIGLKDHPGYTSINKFVASAAKLAGKKRVSCEELTNVSLVFFATLEMIKICGDQSNLSGVNHSVLHGFNYSPQDAAFPGWIQFGTFFNERNPWWPYFKRWSSYKARLSALLQQVEPQADIAIMHPLADKWGAYGQQFQPAFGWGVRVPWYEYDLWPAVHQNGNNCDYVSEKIIREAHMKEGVLHFGKGAYRTLILMEVASIHPDTAQALLDFARAGGRLVFIQQPPSKSTGLKDYQERDRKVQLIMDQILQNYPATCHVVDPPEKDLLGWFGRLQEDLNIVPPVRIDQPHHDIMQAYYRYHESDVYFFINASRTNSHQFRATFAVAGKTPWLWNPETGTRQRLAYDKDHSLTITLQPAESKLIVFDGRTAGDRFEPVLMDPDDGAVLSGDWAVRLTHIKGGEEVSFPLDVLVDFKARPDLKGFAGVITYEKAFDVRQQVVYFVDLGTVHGISELYVDGQSQGVRWYGRHLYTLREGLAKGRHTLQVKITTIMGNYCKTLDNPICQAWTADQPYSSMGLVGPVRILGKA